MTTMTWQDVCNNAVEAAKQLPLTLTSPYSDISAVEGPCRLLRAFIEADDQFDDEALPAFLVATQDGRELVVFEEELTCADEQGLQQLIEGVCMTFGLSRSQGEWVSPAHLMEEADEAAKARFMTLIASDRATKLQALH